MEQRKFRTGRREFLRRSAGGIVSATTLSLLAAHAAWADGRDDDDGDRRGPARRRDYGPLARTPDQNGQEILALPAGFRYVTFSKTGSLMLDGSGPVPGIHDGMAAFRAGHGLIRLIRNHEVRNAAGVMAGGVPHSGAPYDAKAAAGTLTIDFDPDSMRPVREFVSICGTHTNCAGGLAYRDAGWLTCEETTVDSRNGFLQPHGYTFLVPAKSNSAVVPVALKAMGRFSKEAALADDRGIVYQTEDAGNNSGFYRFVPRDAEDLERGGRLQMLAVSEDPLFVGNTGQTVGKHIRCEWVDIEDPDPNLALGAPTCFAQGRARGGAAFNRLEGLHRGAGNSIFFVSTSGGTAQRGQLWQFHPGGRDKGVLALVHESPGSAALDSPDNLCVTPSGAILFCEDDASGADNDTHPLAPGTTNVDRLVGLSRDGVPFEFAVNIHNPNSEFAGACFSPDGDILFVNLQGNSAAGSGMTCAIIGPWRKGPL